VLDKANYATISRLFDKSLLILWPEGIRHENILLFLSDAVPYMVKTGKTIKIFNPKTEHVTCVAHALHRVCEEIRLQFPKVDKLISNMKKKNFKSSFSSTNFSKYCTKYSFTSRAHTHKVGNMDQCCDLLL
jgi:hypothetical protein